MARYYDDKDIIWRTIGGRRIPIRAGQSLSQAMKESGKFNKKSKKEVGEETKKFEESKVENEYINKVSNAKNDKELAEADKYYKDNTGKNWDDGKKEREKEFHYAGEELYSDDPNRFGDTLKKHNEKMNPSKSRDEVVKQLDKDVKESSNNNSSAREKELADKVKHYAVKDGKTVSWTDEEEAKRIYNEDYGANTELRFASDEYMQKRGDSLKQFWKKYNENQVLGKPFDFDEEYKNIEKNITQDDRNYIQDIRKRYKNNAPQSQSRDDVVKQLNEETNEYKRAKHEGFGDYNKNNIPVYDNKIDYTGDFSRADLSKLSDEELTTALNKQSELYKQSLNEKLGDQRTRNGRMDKIFNTAKQQQYENGTNALLKETEKRGLPKYNIYDEKNKDIVLASSPTKEIAERQLKEMYETDKNLQKTYGWKELPKYALEESKNQNNNISIALKQKAYQKYLKEHPSSKMTFNQFKKMEEK